MKESKLIEMKNKVVALTNISQHLLNEVAYIKKLSVGTLELIKNMPDYEEAVEKLKKQVTENPSKDKETKPSGEASE
jgi:predicted ATP-grasp superfamily ATP-dependent carboligase